MQNKREITTADLMPLAEYGKVRVETRRRISANKRNRRVEVGPFVSFYFESYETMWLQVHEMLFIEKGGADQIPDELAAYNPLIPQGRELVATFMIEIDDAARRKRLLGGLGGVEETAFLEIAGERVPARPEADQDRTTAEGKASSVQFVHFDLSDQQVAAFRKPDSRIVLGLSHPNYNHMAVLTEAVRAELVKDFD
jgi:hypothetical protein